LQRPATAGRRVMGLNVLSSFDLAYSQHVTPGIDSGRGNLDARSDPKYLAERFYNPCRLTTRSDMMRRFSSVPVTFAFVMVLPLAASDAAQLSRPEQEKFLQTADITGRKAVTEGITKTSRITLSDGRITHDAHVQTIDVYKPVYRTKEFVEKDFRDSYKYNIAAYRVAKLLKLDDTPTCVYREVDGQPASVCWWVDNVQFDEVTRRDKKIEPPDPEYWTRQLNNIRVFDQLIDNTDRNQGNLLIDKEWKLWMIDHSRAFRTTTVLRKPENLKRVSQSLLDSMRKLNIEDARPALKQFLTDQEIQTMFVRRDLILKLFSDQVSRNGASAVYTDMPVKTPRVTIP
jgi:hypothetical protein